MTCDMAWEAISAALDGALTAAEQTELDAHLASCPACRALYDDLTAIQADTQGGALEVPEGFHDRVMAVVAAETPVRAARPKAGRARWTMWGGLAAAAAVVVLAVGPGRLLLADRGGSGASAPMAYSMTADGEGPAANEAAPALAGESDAPGAIPPGGTAETAAEADAPAGAAKAAEPEDAEIPAQDMADSIQRSSPLAAYRAVVTVDGTLPEGYAWDENGGLDLPAAELEALTAALDAAGTSYTVEDGSAADGEWVLVQPAS